MWARGKLHLWKLWLQDQGPEVTAGEFVPFCLQWFNWGVMIYGVRSSPWQQIARTGRKPGFPLVKGRLRGDLTAVLHGSMGGYSEDRASGAQGRDRRWWLEIAARECLQP